MLSISNIVLILEGLQNLSDSFQLKIKKENIIKPYHLHIWFDNKDLGFIGCVNFKEKLEDGQVLEPWKLYDAEELLPSELESMLNLLNSKVFISQFMIVAHNIEGLPNKNENHIEICINGNWYLFNWQGEIYLEDDEEDKKILIARDKTIEEMVSFINVLRK